MAVAVEQHCGTAINKSGDTIAVAAEHGQEYSNSNSAIDSTATKK